MFIFRQGRKSYEIWEYPARFIGLSCGLLAGTNVAEHVYDWMGRGVGLSLRQ